VGIVDSFLDVQLWCCAGPASHETRAATRSVPDQSSEFTAHAGEFRSAKLVTMMTRRQLLVTIGGVSVLGAAGAGAAVAALSDLPSRAMPPPTQSHAAPAPPPQLVAALAREQALIAGLDAVVAADPTIGVLMAIRADHRAHADAIAAAITELTATSPSAGPTPSPSTSATVATPTVGQLRAAEQSAHQQLAIACGQLRGVNAVLLASIAACEAGHAELLS
jgi:hypothetical protein